MWIAVSSLPAEGAEFEFNDASIWSEPIKEFNMACRITEPLRARVSILPQSGEGVDGCLIKGHLTGEVAVPCNRCAEDAIVTIDADIDTFEPFPTEEDAQGSEEADDLVVRIVNGKPEISVAGLLWEEFAMALPVKPLCRPDCKGLCPVCGMNKNHGECACNATEGDSRLAILRTVKVVNKKRGLPHNA